MAMYRTVRIGNRQLLGAFIIRDTHSQLSAG
jgi:hypothetical protein